MRTSVSWELPCYGLLSHPGWVKDSHLLNTANTKDKHRLTRPFGTYKGFDFSLPNIEWIISLEST